MAPVSWFKLLKAAVGLLLVLLEVSEGAETTCDGREDGALCFAPLEGTVLIQLMNNASEAPKYRLKLEGTVILSSGKSPSLTFLLKNRYIFFPSNGTLHIMNVSRNDSGNYTMETFNSDGKSLKTKNLQLIVKAPVSSAQLVPECLSQGQMKVSCLSEGGDSPQYGWTLNGHTLTDSELLFGNNESNIIVLKQSISGHLVCSVRNQVSVSFKHIQLSTCGFIFMNCSVNGTQIPRWVPKENQTLCDESFHLFIKFFMEPWAIIAGGLGALLIILLVIFAICCARRKKNKNKVEENDRKQADVKGRRRKLQKEKVEEVQVEYGQVKKQRRAYDDMLNSDGADVYAKVCKKA